MTVKELHKRWDNDKLIILDIREHIELDICKIDYSVHIPMNELQEKLHLLPTDYEIVVLCHHGVRSAHVVTFLKENGYPHVHNLEGGIHNWAIEIDNEMTTY